MSASVSVTSCSLFKKKEVILSLYLCGSVKIRVSHKLEHTHAKGTHNLVEEIREKEGGRGTGTRGDQGAIDCCRDKEMCPSL